MAPDRRPSRRGARPVSLPEYASAGVHGRVLLTGAGASGVRPGGAVADRGARAWNPGASTARAGAFRYPSMTPDLRCRPPIPPGQTLLSRCTAAPFAGRPDEAFEGCEHAVRGCGMPERAGGDRPPTGGSAAPGGQRGRRRGGWAEGARARAVPGLRGAGRGVRRKAPRSPRVRRFCGRIRQWPEVFPTSCRGVLQHGSGGIAEPTGRLRDAPCVGSGPG